MSRHKCPQHQTPVTPTQGCQTVTDGHPCQFADGLPPEYFGVTNVSKALKTLRPGEQRYIAKIHSGSGKSAKWGIYDRAMGSWPRTVIGLGQLPEGLTEHAARAEADKVETWYRSKASA
jgi:hypothetical protein